jgi:hypothetical protein
MRDAQSGKFETSSEHRELQRTEESGGRDELKRRGHFCRWPEGQPFSAVA